MTAALHKSHQLRNQSVRLVVPRGKLNATLYISKTDWETWYCVEKPVAHYVVYRPLGPPNKPNQLSRKRRKRRDRTFSRIGRQLKKKCLLFCLDLLSYI